MSHAISNLYEFDEKGWRTYQIDQLSIEEAQVIAQTCPKESLIEGIKTGLLTGGFIVTLALSGFAALAVIKISTVLFAEFVMKAGLYFGVAISAEVQFTAQLLSGGFAFMMGAYGIKVLWKKGINTISQKWAYAAHLDQQAKDALLRKGYLESLANMG